VKVDLEELLDIYFRARAEERRASSEYLKQLAILQDFEDDRDKAKRIHNSLLVVLRNLEGGEEAIIARAPPEEALPELGLTEVNADGIRHEIPF
jgi:hypothetical protein